jgi:hypothetical protein
MVKQLGVSFVFLELKTLHIPITLISSLLSVSGPNTKCDRAEPHGLLILKSGVSLIGLKVKDRKKEILDVTKKTLGPRFLSMDYGIKLSYPLEIVTSTHAVTAK